MKTHKKSQYNKLYFILLFTLVFSTLVFSGVESSAVRASAPAEAPQVGTQELPANSKIFAPQVPTQAASKTSSQAAPAKNAKSAKKATGSTPHKKLFRFLEAMFGVLLSGGIIFGGLKLYKFFVSKKNSPSHYKNSKSSLESPKTFKDTINLFLDKTDK